MGTEFRSSIRAAFIGAGNGNSMMYVVNYYTKTITALRVRSNPEGKKVSCPLVERVEEFRPSFRADPLPDNSKTRIDDVVAADNAHLYILASTRDGTFIIHMQPSSNFASVFDSPSTSSSSASPQTSSSAPVFVKSQHTVLGKVNSTASTLQYVRHTNAHVTGHSSFDISPDGTYVAIGDYSWNVVKILRRDPSSGRITDDSIIATAELGSRDDLFFGVHSVVWGSRYPGA